MPLSNAQKLVSALQILGYHVHGQNFEILHWHGQGMMNKAGGEAAPTWELLVNPLYNTITGRIVAHGERPTITIPDGREVQTEICSHLPLLHILQQPLKEWLITTDRHKRTSHIVGSLTNEARTCGNTAGSYAIPHAQSATEP